MIMEYFSIPAFFILFRETLEVCLLLSMVLICINKSNLENSRKKYLRKRIVIGTAAGVIVSLTVSSVIIIVYYTYQNNIFPDKDRELYEAIIMFVTSGILTFIAFSLNSLLMKYSNRIENLEDHTGRILEKYKKRGLICFSFIITVREGLESILFLAGVGFNNRIEGIIIGGSTGIVSCLIFSCILYKSTSFLKIFKFILITNIFLLLFAIGLVSKAFHELQEASLLGVWSPKENRTWINRPVWDITECCSDKTNFFFGLLRTLFGYQDKATPVEIFAYFGYTIIVMFIAIVLRYKSKRIRPNHAIEFTDLSNTITIS
jgi:high-affinity iron transporter